MDRLIFAKAIWKALFLGSPLGRNLVFQPTRDQVPEMQSPGATRFAPKDVIWCRGTQVWSHHCWK